jgi:flagellar capping protein FliD
MEGDDIESIYSPLPDELYQDVKKWIQEFTDAYNSIQNRVNAEVSVLQKLKSRSEQAKYLYQKPELADIRGLIFAALDGNDISKSIWNTLKKQLKVTVNADKTDQ